MEPHRLSALFMLTESDLTVMNHDHASILITKLQDEKNTDLDRNTTSQERMIDSFFTPKCSTYIYNLNKI